MIKKKSIGEVLDDIVDIGLGISLPMLLVTLFALLVNMGGKKWQK